MLGCDCLQSRRGAKWSEYLIFVHLDCRRRHHLQALHNLRGSARAGLSLPLLAPLHHLPIFAPASRSENARDHGGGGLHRRSRDLVQGRTIHNTYLIQQYNTIRIIQQYARQATPAAVYNTVTVLGVKYTSDKVGGPNTPKYTTVVDLFCGPQIHKIHSEFSPTPNTQNTDITPRVTVVTSAVASRHGPGAAGPGRGRAPAAGRGRAPAAAAAPAPQRSCARAHSLPHHI